MKLAAERFIPTRATKIADKQSDAVAYIYTNASQRPCARVFYGKQTKPVVHCYFRNEADRERSVILAFQARRERQGRVAARRQARTDFVHSYQVGDIFRTSWGYDQTNIEFYEIVEVCGKHVIVRELEQVREYDNLHGDTGTCVPQSNSYKGPAIRKLAQEHGVRICSFIMARPWGKRVAGVVVGSATRWSATY